MATISDIAKKTGFSRTTVSRALNSSKLLNEKTRKKILKAIKELNYSPSLLAQGMRRQKTNSFGVFIPEFKNYYYAELLQYIEIEAIKKGYLAIICTADKDPKREKEYVNQLLSRRVDGFIFCWYRGVHGYKNYLSEIVEQVPVVLLDQLVEDIPVTSIYSDGYQGMKDVTHYLIKKGHTRFSIITTLASSSYSAVNYRFEGFLSALQESNIALESKMVEKCVYGIEEGYEAAKRLLKRGMPHVIITEDDLNAAGVIRYLHERKISVPQEIAVTGFDNISLSRYTIPQITTVAQPIQTIAREAITQLVNNIENKVVENKKIIFPTELIIRESTG